MVLTQYRPRGTNAKSISDSLEKGIQDGALGPGDPLPSVRHLAADLGVAAGTVASAYKMLRDRGLVESRGRNGTSVRTRPPLADRSYSPPMGAGVTDLSSGQPDPALLPPLELAQPLPGTAACAPSQMALPELLTAGRRRLAADAVPTEAVIVCSGALDGIHRVLTARLRPGDAVAIEDPGWPNALDLVAALGMRPLPLSLDEEGPLPASLASALEAGARAVIITSRAHNPTGVSVSKRRSRELRKVLRLHPQTVVIEDDHAAELSQVQLAPLAGATSAWAFIRSTSKPYGPDLRLAVIAGDETTISRVEGRMRVDTGWVSSLLQRVVLDLWTNPEVERITNLATTAYDARRQHLIAELDQRGIDSSGPAGLNVWVPARDETSTVTSLIQSGWAVAPGRRFRQASAPGVRITVSALSQDTIPRLADDLATALGANREHSTFNT